LVGIYAAAKNELLKNDLKNRTVSLMYLNTIGLLGGLINTSSGIPQIIKMIETKKSDDLSWGTLNLGFIGLALTLVYSIGTKQPPIYIPISISLIENTIIQYLKFHYHKKSPEYVSLDSIVVNP